MLQELEYEGPRITVIDGNFDAGGMEWFDALREKFAAGVVDTVMGRVRIVEALLELKEGDRWRHDPLVAHYDNDPTWKDYLIELIAWAKERYPTIQLSLSTLTNYLQYYNTFVVSMGLDIDKVFGAQDQTRRQLLRMAHWYGGEPKQLRNGYDEDRLPDGETLKDKLRVVAEDALAQPRYSPDLFETYHKGDGRERTDVSFALELDSKGYILAFNVYVKKHDGNNNPLASYKVDLMGEPMTADILDYMENRGWTVEMPQ